VALTLEKKMKMKVLCVMTSRDIGTIHHQFHGPPNVLIIFIIINIDIWINLCVFRLILRILKLTIIYTSSDHYISNHIARTCKFFNSKFLLLNYLLNNYFLLNTSCSKIQSPFFFFVFFNHLSCVMFLDHPANSQLLLLKKQP